MPVERCTSHVRVILAQVTVRELESDTAPSPVPPAQNERMLNSNPCSQYLHEVSSSNAQTFAAT